MTKRLASILVVAGLIGAAAPAAHGADVTIGSNLAGPADANVCTGGFACTYIQNSAAAPVAVSPVDGIVVRWRLKAGSLGGTVRLRVLRPAGGGAYTAVASSVTQTVTAATNTFSTGLPIAAGDVIALDNATSGLYFTTSPAIPVALVTYYYPPLADGATGTPNSQRANVELLLNADVTPTLPGTPPPAVPTPVISKLKLKPSRFRAARSGGSVARKRPPVGATVRYRLSTEASVAFGVQRAKKGRKRGGKCRKPGKRPRGRRCTRYVTLRGEFSVGGGAGANRFRFTGRVGGKRLARGRYRLVANPTTSGKTGKPARARFRIR